jgi:hypothetical protein
MPRLGTWFVHGHGSFDEGSGVFSRFDMREDTVIVLYAPPGAALADGMADRIQRWGGAVKGRGYSFVGRESKGMDRDAQPPAGWDDLPIFLTRSGTTPYLGLMGNGIYPNLTLTGSSSLSQSGIYDSAGRCVQALGSGYTMTLVDVMQDYAGAIHWCACVSMSSSNTVFPRQPATGFKVSAYDWRDRHTGTFLRE